MSKDLESLLVGHNAPPGHAASLSGADGAVSLRLGRASVRVEVGRIQDYQSSESQAVIALPANEYFDDECISDTNSSLGAFVQHHFGEHVDDFVRQVRSELVSIPTQRVPRAERRIDDSYGIGEAVFLNQLLPKYRLILVSATTERTGIGLRAEPHFLYAAVRGNCRGPERASHEFADDARPRFGARWHAFFCRGSLQPSRCPVDHQRRSWKTYERGSNRGLRKPCRRTSQRNHARHNFTRDSGVVQITDYRRQGRRWRIPIGSSALWMPRI
jgi:hypothetical protein